jgi:hypothetical protein
MVGVGVPAGHDSMSSRRAIQSMVMGGVARDFLLINRLHSKCFLQIRVASFITTLPEYRAGCWY